MQANEITLYELEERLNLQVATDSNFFTEWLEPIALSEEEKAKCDRIRNQFMRQVLYRRQILANYIYGTSQTILQKKL